MVSEKRAPLDPTLDAGALEVTEVDRMLGAQQLQNAVERLGRLLRFSFRRIESCDAYQSLGDPGGRQHEVRCDGGGARHDIELRRFGTLSERHPSCVANGLQSECSIGVIAGKHDADRVVLSILRQREKETVERTMRNLRRSRHQPEHVALDGHLRIRRNHIDVIALDVHSVDDCEDAIRGRTGENVDEHAVVVRIEMLDEHESESGIDRKRREEIDESVETSGRCADADHAHSGDVPVRETSSRHAAILSGTPSEERRWRNAEEACQGGSRLVRV